MIMDYYLLLDRDCVHIDPEIFVSKFRLYYYFQRVHLMLQLDEIERRK